MAEVLDPGRSPYCQTGAGVGGCPTPVLQAFGQESDLVGRGVPAEATPYLEKDFLCAANDNA